MSDSVERLRTPSIVMREGILNLVDEAANELEALHQRVAELEYFVTKVNLHEGEFIKLEQQLATCEKERKDGWIQAEHVARELAASQRYAKQLREALEKVMKSENRWPDFVIEALSLPRDTSALDALHMGLENCRLLAARHRKEDWALLILGFCAEAGVVGSVTR
jgi:septal ring factor EnvC (AmiA/AmiB activator)